MTLTGTIVGPVADPYGNERYGLRLDHPALEPGRNLPHMLNFFEMRFELMPATGERS